VGGYGNNLTKNIKGDTMKKLILTGLFLAILCVGRGLRAGADTVDSAEKEFSLSLPKLSDLSQKYPNDVEIHLGIADLFRFRNPPRPYSPAEEYQKVLNIDPQNRPASAILSQLEYDGFILKWQGLFEELKGIGENAKQYDWKETPLENKGLLYDYLKTDTGKEVVFTLEGPGSFEHATAVLKEKCGKEELSLLEKTAKTESIDPDNAVYNYFRAGLYFFQDKKTEALEEVKKGIKKKHFGFYEKEMMKARARVLEEIGFRWPERMEFIIMWTPPAGFLISQIWENRFENLGKEYEAAKQFEKAEEIYKMTADMGEQCKKSAFFIDDELTGLQLERIGFQSLEKLYVKMGNEEKKQTATGAIKKLEEQMTSPLRNYSIETYLHFGEEPWTASKLSQFKSLINQIMEKGEIETFKELKNNQPAPQK
jgi:tetratricopeptide (TPR) repeat protein